MKQIKFTLLLITTLLLISPTVDNPKKELIITPKFNYISDSLFPYYFKDIGEINS
jgi:hypothetical protein